MALFGIVITLPVLPLFHVYDVAPVAVNVMLPPSQVNVEEEMIVGEGGALITTVASPDTEVAVLLHADSSTA